MRGEVQQAHDFIQLCLGNAGIEYDADPIEETPNMRKFFIKVRKEEVSLFAKEAWDQLLVMYSVMEKQQQQLDSLSARLIESQDSVVNLQRQIISDKDDQLRSISNTVESSVKQSFQTEMKTYSDIVTNSQPAPAVQISTETLEKVFRTVVSDEDRSKNLMVFGLEEEESDSESLQTKVGSLLVELGEKPRFMATRLGKKESGDRIRAVKVEFSTSSQALQIARMAGGLKQSQVFSKVFIRPDRTLEQRKERRTLVEELKQKKKADPEGRYSIRGGRVVSSDGT